LCFGFAGSSSAGFVPLVNASRLPSGDHAGAPAPFASAVIATASPPVIGSTWSWPGFSASLTRMNASVLLSGDQRAWLSLSPLVSGRGGPPLHSRIHSAVRYSSASRSTLTRVNTMRWPSGDMRGSAIQTKSSRSSSQAADGGGSFGGGGLFHRGSCVTGGERAPPSQRPEGRSVVVDTVAPGSSARVRPATQSANSSP
jgi:hypothetical protein